MLVVNLKPIMEAKGLRRIYSTLVKTGVPVAAARALADGSVQKVSLAYLERICLLLKCTPNDVLMWVPGDGQSVEGQPLAELRNSAEKGLEWLATLKDMPADRLRELGEKLKGMEGGK